MLSSVLVLNLMSEIHWMVVSSLNEISLFHERMPCVTPPVPSLVAKKNRVMRPFSIKTDEYSRQLPHRIFLEIVGLHT
jgi:hypothetical protein